MSESKVPDFVPEYLNNPKISAPLEGYVEKEYDDGVIAWIELGSNDIETRFPNKDLYYDNSGDDSPVFIKDGAL